MVSDVGLDKNGSAKTAEALNHYLADLQILYAKLHAYHWNLEGPMFFPLHEKLQEIYEAVAESIDEIAERILMIGHRPLTKLGDYQKHAKIKEAESEKVGDDQTVRELLGDHQHLIKSIRGIIETAGEIGDEGTVDLVTGELRAHEKTVWMLSAHLG